MPEMIGYIFGSLQNHSKALYGFQKKFKHQAQVNRNLAVFVLVMSTHAIVTECTIRRLEAEIEELKRGD